MSHAAYLQPKVGTSGQWGAATTPPLVGEWCHLLSSTGDIVESRVGNGSKTYYNLNIVGGNASSVNPAGPSYSVQLKVGSLLGATGSFAYYPGKSVLKTGALAIKTTSEVLTSATSYSIPSDKGGIIKLALNGQKVKLTTPTPATVTEGAGCRVCYTIQVRNTSTGNPAYLEFATGSFECIGHHPRQILTKAGTPHSKGEFYAYYDGAWYLQGVPSVDHSIRFFTPGDVPASTILHSETVQGGLTIPVEGDTNLGRAFTPPSANVAISIGYKVSLSATELVFGTLTINTIGVGTYSFSSIQQVPHGASVNFRSPASVAGMRDLSVALQTLINAENWASLV